MSTVGFTTTDKLEAKVKKLGAQHNLVLTGVDSTIALRRLENAYEIVIGALVNRGLTKAEADTWRRGEEFQLDIATYWYGCDSGWLRMQRDERDWLKVFNREAELATVVLLKADFTQLVSDSIALKVWNVDDDLEEDE